MLFYSTGVQPRVRSPPLTILRAAQDYLAHSEPGDGHINEDLVVVRPTAFSARPTPGWTLLVVSDGVWKYVGWESIAETADRHRGPEMIDALLYDGAI